MKWRVLVSLVLPRDTRVTIKTNILMQLMQYVLPLLALGALALGVSRWVRGRRNRALMARLCRTADTALLGKTVCVVVYGAVDTDDIARTAASAVRAADTPRRVTVHALAQNRNAILDAVWGRLPYEYPGELIDCWHNGGPLIALSAAMRSRAQVVLVVAAGTTLQPGWDSAVHLLRDNRLHSAPADVVSPETGVARARRVRLEGWSPGLRAAYHLEYAPASPDALSRVVPVYPGVMVATPAVFASLVEVLGGLPKGTPESVNPRDLILLLGAAAMRARVPVVSTPRGVALWDPRHTVKAPAVPETFFQHLWSRVGSTARDAYLDTLETPQGELVG